MALGTHTDQLTLGRGELYFAPFGTDGATPRGERYIGNTTEFNLTIEEEKLEHYNSDRGVKEKDRAISLSTNRSGSFTTDNCDMDNLAMFFFGTKSTVTVVGATVTDEVIAKVQKDRYFQLGASSGYAGVKGLDQLTAGSVNITVKNSAASVTYVEGTDYKVDMDTARIYIIPTGAIVEDSDIKVSYKTKSSTRYRILSGSTAIKGALRYVAQNPEGAQVDYYFPSVTISPNGDFALKGDEWTQIPFNLEVLKATGKEAIIGETRAV